MTIGSRRFKRVILGDTALASDIERNLEKFADTTLFPSMFARYEHEIWLDYVAGAQPSANDSGVAERLADFYAMLYARDARHVPLQNTRVPARLQRDLRFLNDAGVISTQIAEELARAAARLAPREAWMGYDYTDPVLKNFVRVDGGALCAIDIEALCSDQLVGLGVAKALDRWAEPHRETLLKGVLREGVPNFGRYFGYVELVFLAAYTTLMVLERKWKYVEPSGFERLLRRAEHDHSQF